MGGVCSTEAVDHGIGAVAILFLQAAGSLCIVDVVQSCRGILIKDLCLGVGAELGEGLRGDEGAGERLPLGRRCAGLLWEAACLPAQKALPELRHPVRVGASGEGRGGHPPPAEPQKDGQLLLAKTRALEEGPAGCPPHGVAFLGRGRDSAQLLLVVGSGQSLVRGAEGPPPPQCPDSSGKQCQKPFRVLSVDAAVARLCQALGHGAAYR